MAEKNAFAKLLDDLATKKKESEKMTKESGEKGATVESDDLNILPLPTTQRVGTHSLTWTWTCDTTLVVSTLDVVEDRYHVTLRRTSWGEEYLAGDNAKILGQALISAWNWKNVWKQHAGELLLRTMKDDVERDVENAENAGNVESVESVESVEIRESLGIDGMIGQP